MIYVYFRKLDRIYELFATEICAQSPKPPSVTWFYQANTIIITATQVMRKPVEVVDIGRGGGGGVWSDASFDLSTR